MLDIILDNLVMIIVVVAILAVIAVLSTGYIKASPDRAFVISGFKKEPRVLIGRAGIKIPFFEKKDVLTLELVQIDVKTSSPVPTADYINLDVNAAVNVKISKNPMLLERAMQGFLNKDTDSIRNVAREVLEGNMREIIGKMELREMVTDRKKFSDLVAENAKTDLEEMGLEVINFNVQSFEDGNGVIEDLGIDNVEQIKKGASMAKIQARKEVDIMDAEAKKQMNDARIKAETEIALRNNELAIKEAELKKEADAKKAEANAAYRIQEEQQRKTIEETTMNADIAKREKEIELQRQEVAVEKERLDAEVKQKAEADRYAAQQKADADKYIVEKKAEADLIRREKDAEAIKIEMEKEADGIRALGEAKATAKRQELKAEADGMREKAEAFKQYGQAAIAEMLINVLPQMAAETSKAVSGIDKITIIDGGDGNGDGGVGKVGGFTPLLMAKTMETVKAATGIDINDIIKKDTYDASVNRNVTIDINGEKSTKVSSAVEDNIDEIVEGVVTAEISEALKKKEE